MSEWKIVDENTPRDGTKLILAFKELKSPVLGCFIDSETIVNGKSTGRRRYWSTGMALNFLQGDPEPTHWMLLPEMPGAADV